MPPENDPGTGQETPEQIAAREYEAKVTAGVTAKLPEALKAALPEAVKAALPDAVKAATAVPEDYDLKLPENAVLQADDIPGIKTFAKSLGLTQEKAVVLVNALNSQSADIVQQQKTARENMLKKWDTDAAADEEIGGKDGSKLTATQASVDKVLAKFGSPELTKFLTESGIGKMPEIRRALARIGNAMKDDVVDSKSGGGDPNKGKKSTADKLYGEGTVVGARAA